MGQLTNQFVSQSYQGLLNLENANTGVTATLQYVTDGVGNRLPMLASTSSVVITGSFRGDGSGLTGVTTTLPSGVVSGSVQIVDLGFATTSSLDTLSGSIAVTDLAQNNRLTSLEQFTGSIDTGYVSEAEFGTYTSSMNNFTSSIDSRVDALEIETGSLQNQINGLATTGSLNSYTLTSSFNAYTSSNNTKVNELISKTGSYVTETESGSFVTNVIQPAFINNSINVFKGDGTSSTIIINNVASASFAQNAVSASWANNSNRNGLITTGSIGGNQSITGSLNVQGTISATSASFTYVNTVYETASVIYSSGSNQFGDASDDTQTLYGTVILPNLNQYSGSTSNKFVTWNDVPQRLEYTDTVPSSSYAVTSSIAFDVVVYGKCNNPGGLTRGTVVRIVGANGDNPLFDSASWTDDLNSANTLGILSEDVASNAFANIVVQGKLIGINTSGMTAGDMLYLSSSGQYTTSSVPAPYHEVRLGQVLRPQLNNGSMYVNIDNGYELQELHDVDISGVTAGDMLIYRSGSYGQWVNESISEIGLATTGSNTFTGQQNIETNLNVTQSLNVGGNSTFDGQTTYNDTIQYNADSFIKSGSQINFNIGDGQDGKFYRLSRKVGGEFGIVEDPGNYHLLDISSSFANFLPKTSFQNGVDITGSLNVSGSSTLNVISPNDRKQNLVLLSGKNQVTSSTVLNNYLNAVTTSLDNDDVNFGLIPGGGLIGPAGLVPFTGSIFISGSNNFILNLGSQAPASQGRRGIVGNANFVQSVIPTINTSSLTIPSISNNYFGSTLALTLTTGSNLGHNAHAFNSNILLGAGMTFNHPSASIGAGISTNVSANLNIGNVTSNASGSLLTAQTSFNNNLNLHPALVLNHISSSINSTNNFFIGGAAMNINNRYYNTGSNNSVAVSANILTGQNNVVNFAGSPSTNVSRTLVGNLVGGQNNNLSLEQTGTDLGGLRNSVVFGHNLNVTGSHSAAGTAQGAAFLGRYNGEDNGLADSARTILAVGTGTGASNRRTGFYITSGSLVGVSGSMDIKGVTNALVVTGSQTIQHSVAGQPALTVKGFDVGQPALLVSGTFNVTGSGDHNIIGNSTTITGSVRLSNVMNLQPLDPLPAGNIGDLAVSSSNQLYFYNGAWTLVV